MSAPSMKPAAPSRSCSSHQWSLALFVVRKDDDASLRIERRLNAVLQKCLHDNYTLEVIDIASNPDLADAANIIAVPTVIRKVPLPERRIIGDLSNEGQTIAGLGIPLGD
jgi:circadian clock protein KaiB